MAVKDGTQQNPLINDVVPISNALLRQGFEVFAGHPRLDEDRRSCCRRFGAFSQSITPVSVAPIYHAGHGVRSGGQNFLVLANSVIPARDEDYNRIQRAGPYVTPVLRRAPPEGMS